MPSPLISLFSQIRNKIFENPHMLSAFGGPHLFDDVPQHIRPPYMSFGPTHARDWSTAREEGIEQDFTLDIWSAQPGRQEVLFYADLVTSCLREARLKLEGWHMVHLRLLSTQSSRENGGRLARASLNWQALLERIPIS